MNIRGICVSVDYSDLLAVGLQRWDEGLDRILIVTSTKDKSTQALCAKYNIPTHVTNVFYANGARFNKGAALSEAVLATGWRQGADWLLTFDSDIVPPADWRQTVERANPRPGWLYGAWRYENPENSTLEQCDIRRGPKIHQAWVIGFFCLFHSTDRRLPPEDEPLFDIHWTHAGNYDTSFSWRWPRPSHHLFLPINTIHLGEQRQHWLGRGHGQELRAMLGQRRHFDDVKREMIPAPDLKVPIREV